MIQVKITNIINGRTFDADFENQNQADVWINEQIEKQSWGKSDRWVKETDGTHTDVRGQDGDVEYFFPKEYSIEITDVTAQHDEEQRIANLIAIGQANRAKCEKALALIGGHNETNALTVEQILALITTFADINNALKNNMPSTAKALISAVVVEGLVTQQLKDDLLGVL